MYSSLKPYEKIEFILRPHWLILFFEFLRLAVLVVIGFIIYFLANSYFLGQFLELSQFVLVVYLLVVWQIFFRSLVDYYLDTWIVTDHRIIDIFQKGLFSRDISELRYSKIQDISVKVEGFIPTLFNYGDVVIQTAGAVQEFKFIKIPRPNQVKDKILHIYDQFAREHVNDIEIHENLGENNI